MPARVPLSETTGWSYTANNTPRNLAYVKHHLAESRCRRTIHVNTIVPSSVKMNVTKTMVIRAAQYRSVSVRGMASRPAPQVRVPGLCDCAWPAGEDYTRVRSRIGGSFDGIAAYDVEKFVLKSFESRCFGLACRPPRIRSLATVSPTTVQTQCLEGSRADLSRGSGHALLDGRMVLVEVGSRSLLAYLVVEATDAGPGPRPFRSVTLEERRSES